jgi:hypothetical protein
MAAGECPLLGVNQTRRGHRGLSGSPTEHQLGYDPTTPNQRGHRANNDIGNSAVRRDVSCARGIRTNHTNCAGDYANYCRGDHGERNWDQREQTGRPKVAAHLSDWFEERPLVWAGYVRAGGASSLPRATASRSKTRCSSRQWMVPGSSLKARLWPTGWTDA